MQTAVRKSTRLEYKPPKIKHLTTLKNITVENPQNIQEILIALEKRLKEGYWIVKEMKTYFLVNLNCTF